MLLHELIDRDEPKCLYCNSGVDTRLTSEWIPKTALKADHEGVSCHSCNEVFGIYSFQKSDGETVYTGFTFTCREYNIYFDYSMNCFDVKIGAEYVTTIPFFTVDFSDKEKLCEKLKTYCVFS
jgi:hypothetical protein